LFRFAQSHISIQGVTGCAFFLQCLPFPLLTQCSLLGASAIWELASDYFQAESNPSRSIL
jgi:hypothetical protein